MKLSFVHKYPFLRLLLPFMAGIWCGDHFYSSGDNRSPELFFYLLAASALLTVLFYVFAPSYKWRWLFGLSSLFAFFFSGLVITDVQLQKTNISFADTELTYRVCLLEKPEPRDKSIRCKAMILQANDSLANLTADANVFLYFTPTSKTVYLRRGDELLINTRFQTPLSNGNPDEFDYPLYLRRNEIAATAYVPNDKFVNYRSDNTFSLRQLADDSRNRILSLYRRLGFQDDHLAVLSALTLGDKSSLSDDIRETYSVVGASHLLAISGMHIAVIYSLLAICLYWLPVRWKFTHIIRTVIIILCLWLYAFFTGFSPSAVRAVSMFTFLLLARIINHEYLPLNTLFATAFFILLFRPMWLFDIGFQLSFVAVVSMLTVQPLLFNSLNMKHWVARKFWGLITITLAAQLGVAPLVCFYFSRFSTHFILSGLILIAFTTIIIYTTALMLLLTPIPFLQVFVAGIINHILQWQHQCARWIENLPYASFDNLWFSKFEIVLFYLFLFFLFFFFKSRKSAPFMFSAFCLMAAIGFRAHALYASPLTNSIIIYNQRNAPAVHCIDASGQSWIVNADSTDHYLQLKKTMGRYWNRLRLDEPVSLMNDFSNEKLTLCNSIISYAGRNICIIADDRWKNQQSSTPLFVDDIYLCKGYTGTIAGLNRLFNTNRIIFDASVSSYRHSKYMAECDSLGLPYISLSTQGSLNLLP